MTGPAEKDRAPRRDPGLQPERTRLAWRRTTLSCTAVALLAARRAAQEGGSGRPAALLTLVLVGLAWLAFLITAQQRVRALSTARPPALSPRTALTLTACALALTASGAALLLRKGQP
ncbi:DUF202 domain-containing protein [Streptomyces sp. MST-110588]|uniref:DUF202 domain-containing protein n=1 Tax=Streptomyces sp. MST-110588 TaxID=2833628 RepID=UPI001F5C658B|nr:DUF202 domain-containing protein [Streptomyces sp. MST-110588]UNO42953.1 DUF202 domain-containing protein [Streptomyces sp. MST-110588]